MPIPFELPPWLQIVVAASAVISSLGVVVALIQIGITKDQFKTQLAITTEQFTLLNQGYLNLDAMPSLYSPQIAPGSPMVPGATYQSIRIEAVIENVGNTPLVYASEYSRLYFNDVEVFDLPVNIIGSSVCYPKQKTKFGMCTVNFQPGQHLLSTAQIQALNITCKFKFTYHDFNSDRVKSIERTLIIKPEDYGVFGTYSEINDRL